MYKNNSNISTHTKLRWY